MNLVAQTSIKIGKLSFPYRLFSKRMMQFGCPLVFETKKELVTMAEPDQ